VRAQQLATYRLAGPVRACDGAHEDFRGLRGEHGRRVHAPAGLRDAETPHERAAGRRQALESDDGQRDLHAAGRRSGSVEQQGSRKQTVAADDRGGHPERAAEHLEHRPRVGVDESADHGVGARPRRPTATLAAGCGGDDNNADTGAAASEKQQRRPPTVPADLLGRYTTTLQGADIPKTPPPELTDGSPRWKLTIAKSGGIENGPAFTIANAQLGVLESSNFVAQEGTVLLENEECAAPGGKQVYANKYRYTLSGDTLRFTTIPNGCADKVAETILTSRPWQRSR
jgi:hypothetical protein